MSKAGLNGSKLQSVKSLYVFFCETSELLGSCDLNAGVILNEDGVFRKIFEVRELF
jgi:hypothetical protein